MSVQFTGSPALGVPLSNITFKINKRLKDVEFLPGYFVKWPGIADKMSRKAADMSFAFLPVLLLTYPMPPAIIGVPASLYYTGILLHI